MTFEAWLADQRHQIATIRLKDGDYIARFMSRSGVYAAEDRMTTVVAPPKAIVQVTRLGAVRARVLLPPREYDFEPAWLDGKGIYVRRVSPRDVRDSETAEHAEGLARAAVLKAAEREYVRMQSIAMDAAERGGGQWERILQLLVRGAWALPPGVELALAAALAERSDGVELAVVPRACGCAVCGRGFRSGDHEMMIAFGTTVACTACVRPAKAA